MRLCLLRHCATMRVKEARQPVQSWTDLRKIVEEGCGVNGSGHKGDGPGVLGRLGREGRQSCPHAVPTCKHIGGIWYQPPTVLAI